MNCRFCYSSNTKLTSSINDEIVQKFLNFIPQLDIEDDHKYPSSVCQLCYGKTKISFDFIQKIIDVQQKLGTSIKSGRSRLKISNATSISTNEAFEKVQKVGTISIKKVSAINQSVTPNEEVMFKVEVEDQPEDEFFAMDDNSSDEDFQVQKVESEDDEEYLEDDDLSDDDFEPTSKKKRTSGSKVKKAASKGKRKTGSMTTIEKSWNSFDDSREIINKEIIIEAPIAFSCAKCRDKFPTFDALTSHMKSRACHNDKSICKECGKMFLNKKSLYNHLATHKPKEKVICEICAKQYSQQFDLESHMEAVHHIVKRDCIYRCTHCDQKFHSQKDLLDHVKDHQREKKEAPRLCEICAKVCANLKAYQSHILIHKEKKAHTCQVCGKGFAKLFLFQQHMHVHTGIKAFTCDICDKSYAKRDSLRIHKKRDHTNLT